LKGLLIIIKQEHKHIIDPNIIAENKTIARAAYERGDYVLCFLLIHSLIEVLSRAFLSQTGKESFNELIDLYKQYIKEQGQVRLTFVDELTQFNRRRNRVVHNLWKHGYRVTNEKLKPACRAAFIMFGLFIEWLETFDPAIIDLGFHK